MSFNEIDDMYSKIAAPILNTKPKLQSYNKREKRRYNHLLKNHIEKNEVESFNDFLKTTNICIVYSDIEYIVRHFMRFQNGYTFLGKTKLQ